MNLFPLHKGLLWKEWRQNRWLFWTGLVLLSLEPIFTLFDMLMRLIQPTNGFTWAQYRQMQGVEFDALADGHASVFVFKYGIYAAIVLGVILLAQERMSPTLDFLAATPVSRRQILAAKYATGLRMIGTVWLVNLLYVLLMGEICSHDFPIWHALLYFVDQGSVLAAIYSLSFCASAVCGNLFSAVIGGFVLVYAPWMLIAFLRAVISPVAPNFQASAVYETIHLLFLPYYIQELQLRQEPFVFPVMFVLCAVFYLLAVFLFERNPFEKNGHLLLFGRLMPLLQVGVPLMIALVISMQDRSPYLGIVHFAIVFAVVYGLIRLFYRLRHRFGFR